MNLDLTGEVALVTGASRGIGKAIAQELAAAGATVYGTATSEGGAAAISEYLGREDAGRVLQLDNAEQLTALTDIAPTILVNNAGITRDNLLMRMKDDDWDAVIDTNLSGVYRVVKTFMRGMIKAKKGRIVNITSVVGLLGTAGQANYVAAKAGLVGLTKSLARELASRNITANAVAPGFIDTDMTKDLNPAQREAALSQVPLNRGGAPEDIAAAVLFLVSPAGSYITGETLNVNGGMYMP